MKLVLDNGQEIILTQETSDVIMQEIENNTKPMRNFNHEEGVKGFYIPYHGQVMPNNFSTKEEINNLNSFTTEKYTEKIARRQYIDRLILNFIDENRVNWFDSNDFNTPKYHIFYSIQDKEIKISSYSVVKQSTWCFPTEELAQQCIDKYENELIEFFTMEV